MARKVNRNEISKLTSLAREPTSSPIWDLKCFSISWKIPMIRSGYFGLSSWFFISHTRSQPSILLRSKAISFVEIECGLKCFYKISPRMIRHFLDPFFLISRIYEYFLELQYPNWKIQFNSILNEDVWRISNFELKINIYHKFYDEFNVSIYFEILLEKFDLLFSKTIFKKHILK